MNETNAPDATFENAEESFRGGSQETGSLVNLKPAMILLIY